MDDASWLNQLLLQYLSSSPTATAIDNEMASLGDDLLGDQPALTYLRYNASLEEKALRQLDLDSLAGHAERLREMSLAENRHELNLIGAKAAARMVDEAHFPPAFRLPNDVQPI